MTTLMYKNKIGNFSFWMVKVQDLKMAELHTQGSRYAYRINPFLLPSAIRLESSWLYNVSDTYTNSRGCTSPTWTCFLACHPCNLHDISAKNTCIMFTLGARCISHDQTSAVASTDVKWVKSISNIRLQNDIHSFLNILHIFDTEYIKFIAVYLIKISV